MPFFRPERALARLLRHDPFAPFSPSHFHSPLSLTRFIDHHTPFAAPLYTIFEEPRDNTHQHNNPRLNQTTDKDQTTNNSNNNKDSQVARSESEDGMERRHRRHRGRHHLSPLHNNFFSSPFPSLFNSSFPLAPGFTPFTPSSLPSMPEMTLDMFSTPTSYSIHAAVPGLDKKDIKLTVDDGVLTIEAERRESRSAPNSASTSSSSTTSTPQTVETKAEEKPAAGPTTATTNAQSTQSTESIQSTQPATASTSSSPSPADSAEDDGLSVHHVESFYGRVERSVQLPDDARADELTAKYEDGVIKIEIPRQQEQKKQARRIEIQ